MERTCKARGTSSCLTTHAGRETLVSGVLPFSGDTIVARTIGALIESHHTQVQASPPLPLFGSTSAARVESHVGIRISPKSSPSNSQGGVLLDSQRMRPHRLVRANPGIESGAPITASDYIR